MSILSESDSLILAIDIQEKLVNAVFNKSCIEEKSQIMIKAAKILDIPTILTEQYPKGLGDTISSVKEYLPDNSKMFEKASFSALDEEDIFDTLKSSNRHQVIVFGIETHICVSQTVNALIELGYEVSVISDACSSRNKEEHEAGINRMREDGAHILTTEIALFEWLRTSKHEKFKEIQALIK